ncbi:MAG: alpha/beta hydrolase [Planctomycetes bacterium]|nr:alpha/beta hydrolase [Planctomycetota bacterium]
MTTGPAASRDAAAGSRFRRDMGARSIDVGGVSVSFVERGSGAPIFFFHGLGGCVYDWREQLAPFAEAGFRAIAVDLPGAGFSPTLPGGDFRIESIARHAAAVVRALAGGPAVLVGNSYGGLIALATAIHHADVVAQLVLVDAVSYRQPHPYFVPLFRIPALPKMVTPILPVRPFLRMVLRGAVAHAACISDAVIEEYALETKLPGRRESVVEIVRALVRENPDDFAARIPTIRVPTLVVWGELDPAVPIANGRRLAREIAGAELVVIPECGHLPHMEKPAEFRRVVLDFVRRGR